MHERREGEEKLTRIYVSLRVYIRGVSFNTEHVRARNYMHIFVGTYHVRCCVFFVFYASTNSKHRTVPEFVMV